MPKESSNISFTKNNRGGSGQRDCGIRLARGLNKMGKHNTAEHHLVQAINDTVPSPRNLYKRSRLKHLSVLCVVGKGPSNISPVAAHGPDWWSHHDQVLKAIAEKVHKAIKSSKYHPGKSIPQSCREASFMNTDKSLSVVRQDCGLVCAITFLVWQLRGDLGKQLKFQDPPPSDHVGTYCTLGRIHGRGPGAHLPFSLAFLLNRDSSWPTQRVD